jgi:hypothetical protein
MTARKTGHLRRFYRPVNAKYTHLRWSADPLIEHGVGTPTGRDTIDVMVMTGPVALGRCRPTARLSRSVEGDGRIFVS